MVLLVQDVEVGDRQGTAVFHDQGDLHRVETMRPEHRVPSAHRQVAADYPGVQVGKGCNRDIQRSDELENPQRKEQYDQEKNQEQRQMDWFHRAAFRTGTST